MPRATRPTLRLLVALALVPATGLAQGTPTLLQQLPALEDRRAATPEDERRLMEALRDADPVTRRIAVRTVGRLERPSFTAAVAPLLRDTDAGVRAEAANALAQMAQGAGRGRGADSAAARTGEVTAIAGLLRERTRDERDLGVRGVLARSLGRLPYGSAEAVTRASRDIAGIYTAAVAAAGNDATLFGVLHGLEALARRNARTGGPDPSAYIVARTALAHGLSRAGRPEDDGAARIRTLAILALNSARLAAPADVERALEDPSPQVRRVAVLAAAALPDSSLRATLVAPRAADPDEMVRLEALRTYARVAARRSCPTLVAAAAREPARVAVVALEAMGTACAGDTTAVRVLRAAAQPRAVATSGAWQPAATALASLARIAPADARPLLASASTQSRWQVRAWAARAAAAASDTARLRRLAGDADDNVRTAAIEGLRRLVGHAADSIYRANLARADYELVMTSANALEGTRDRSAATTALLAALGRLTTERRENTRDPRMAILARLGEVGDRGSAGALTSYTTDFDSTVARSAAALVGRWSGRAVPVQPRALPVETPPFVELESLVGARLRVTMEGSEGTGTFEIALDPAEAPLSVARVVRLARRGYYNGLTWHRIAPNFVIQGGSPGANEYVGDGPFMRDELGLRSHVLGTVGISTRGRDTGDAQLFVNLVDNFRLDHDYTIIGRITTGLDVARRIQEGDRMVRVEVVAGR